jgi:hypothetical protein
MELWNLQRKYPVNETVCGFRQLLPIIFVLRCLYRYNKKCDSKSNAQSVASVTNCLADYQCNRHQLYFRNVNSLI